MQPPPHAGSEGVKPRGLVEHQPLHLGRAAGSVQRHIGAGRMTEHIYGRADRRGYRGHILVFARDVVISRVGVAVPVATPVHRIDREMLSEQRQGWSPEAAVDEPAVHQQECRAGTALVKDDSSPVAGNDGSPIGGFRKSALPRSCQPGSAQYALIWPGLDCRAASDR